MGRAGGNADRLRGGAQYLMEREELEVSYLAPDTADLPPDTVAAILEAVDRAAPQGTILPPTASPATRPDAPIAVPGTLLRGVLDANHWLTFGYEQNELPLLAQSLPLRFSTEGANPVVYADGDRLVLSGFVWPDNTVRTYANRPYATVDELGAGKVILFAEDPIYRGVYDAPMGLLMNAIFVGARERSGREY